MPMENRIPFFNTGALLSLLFFLYPFTTFQFVYGELNIPFSDILAMVLSVIFAFFALGQFFLRMNIPSISRKGIVFYGLFLLIALLSMRNAPIYSESLYYLVRKPVFYFLVYYIAIGSLIGSLEKGALLKLYRAILWSSIFISLLSIGTFFYLLSKNNIWSFTEVPYLTDNNKTFAITLVTNLPFLISRASSLKGREKNNFKIAIALVALAIILSLSKTAWMMLALIFTFYNYGNLKRFGFLKVPVLFTSAVVFIIGSAGVYYIIMTTKKVTGAEISRLFLALSALSFFFEHPFIGSGIGSFLTNMKEMRDKLPSKFLPATELDAHGLVFKLLSETGLLGFLFFSIFFVAVTLSIFKMYKHAEDSEFKKVLFGCLVATVTIYISNSFFGTDTYSPRLWFPLTFAAAHVLVAKGHAYNIRVNSIVDIVACSEKE